jgi:hypothetical protein
LLGQEAKDDAKRLLEKSTDHQVQCICLTLLGQEAKDDAKRLLEKSTDHQVQCICLTLLGQEAKSYAVAQIDNWTHTDPRVLLRCFLILGDTPETRETAAAILSRWSQIVPSEHRIIALQYGVESPLRIQRAQEVLADWVNTKWRPLVTAALRSNWEQPEVVPVCREIINRWHEEIKFQISHGHRRYDGHIVQAMSHPDLHQEALKVAYNMVSQEWQTSGFLTPPLFKQAARVISVRWKTWDLLLEIMEEEATEPVSQESP